MKPILYSSIIFFLAVLLTSCGHSKQYNSCGDLASSLKYVQYSELAKEWGEPIKKEERGMDYYVTWSGVGVNGADKELMFKLDYLTGTTVSAPFQFEGISCDDNKISDIRKIELPPANLDPITKYNQLHKWGGAARRNINLTDDNGILDYIHRVPFQLYFPTDNQGINRLLEIHFITGMEIQDKNFWRYYIRSGNDSGEEGKFRLGEKQFDNSREIHLITMPNWTVLNHDTTSGKRLDVKLFSNGTLMVSVQDLADFMGGYNLTSDTSKYWTLDK